MEQNKYFPTKYNKERLNYATKRFEKFFFAVNSLSYRNEDWKEIP